MSSLTLTWTYFKLERDATVNVELVFDDKRK